MATAVAFDGDLWGTDHESPRNISTSIALHALRTVRERAAAANKEFPDDGLLTLIVLLALPSGAFAQSLLLDDAHTSTAARSLDSNFIRTREKWS